MGATKIVRRIKNIVKTHRSDKMQFWGSKSEQIAIRNAILGAQNSQINTQSVPKRVPERAERHPKDARREPLATQMGPKGAKREPKGDKSRLRRGYVSDRFWARKRSSRQTRLAPFWEPKSIPNRWKYQCQNRCRKSKEKYWRNYAKSHQMLIKIWCKIWSLVEKVICILPKKNQLIFLVLGFAQL